LNILKPAPFYEINGIYRQGEKYEIPWTPVIFMIRRDQILYMESSESLDGNK